MALTSDIYAVLIFDLADRIFSKTYRASQIDVKLLGRSIPIQEFR